VSTCLSIYSRCAIPRPKGCVVDWGAPQIDFHEFSKRREAIEEMTVVIGLLMPFPKTDTIKSAQLARDNPIAIAETRVVSK
jgi:hypothetical protein